MVLVIAVVAAFMLSGPGLGQDCSRHKTCPQMRDCAEADFYLRQCGDTDRDADSDGIPCEAICGKTMETYLLRRGGAAPALLSQPPMTLACDGKRTCSQMATCEEAKFYLRQCGVQSLDRNGDGVPCESICR